MRVLFFLILISLSAPGQGQSNHWEFTLSGGISIPLGKFSNNNTVSSLLLDPDSPFERSILGLEKSNNGFAKTGWMVSTSVTYFFTPTFGLSVLGQYVTNPVDTELISSDMSEFWNFPTRYEEEDYRSAQVLMGPRFNIINTSFQLSILPLMGFSWLTFPHYDRFVSFLPGESTLFGQREENKSIPAFIWGGTLQGTYEISPKIKLGFESGYFHSTYSFSINNYRIPGQAIPFNYKDEVNYSVFTASLLVSYRF